MALERIIIPAIIPCLAAGAAHAGTELWVIEEVESSVAAQYESSVDTSGTLIGDWDQEANPEGTQTRPGYFGGSGNIPIDLSVDQFTSVNGVFQPVGGFALNVDTELQLISIEGLTLEMPEGDSFAMDLTAVMLFDTFRSITPDSLYIGGIELPLPLGSGELTSWSLVMDGISSGLMVESGKPGTWMFAVPATLVMSAGGTLQGAPVELPPLPLPVLINGTYTEQGDDRIVLLDFSDQASETQEFDPPVELPDVPLELPTIIPAGSFAGVILSMVTNSAGILVGADAQVTARPDVQDVPGDVTGDGHVGVDDLLLVISSWGFCPGCDADIDGDDYVGVDELLVVLQYWGN